MMWELNDDDDSEDDDLLQRAPIFMKAVES